MSQGAGGGRPCVPTLVKKLRGTYRKDRAKADGPKFETKEFTNPFNVTTQRVAYDEWNRVAPEFIRTGLLHVASYQTVVRMCNVLADIVSLEETVHQDGRLVRTPIVVGDEQVGERLEAHPAMKLLLDARKLYNQLLNEFGGNPSSASKVASQKKPEAKKNAGSDFDSMFGTKRSKVG
jgi:P27 family predicted phage terminase small subunit